MAIDVFFLIALIIGFTWGFKKGIIHSTFAFIAFFFGILIALKFSHAVAFFLQNSAGITSRFLPFIAFIVLFILVIIIVRIISAILEKIINTLFLGFINRLAGGLLWSILITLIFSTLVWFANQVNFLSPELKSGSTAYPYLESLSPIIINFFAQLIPYFEGMFDALEELINNYSSSSQEGPLV